MYLKQCAGVILVRKSTDFPNWIKWVHQPQSENHCEECLKLDGCFFPTNNHPIWPHHPHCHCILEPVSYAMVLKKSGSQ